MAEELPLSEDPPWSRAGENPLYDQLRPMFTEHRKWIESGGKDGKKLDKLFLNLSGMPFSVSNLRSVRFSSVDLSKADLRGVDMTDAWLHGCKLHHADLRGSKLVRSDFSYANLINAYLRDSDLTGIRLDGSNVSGVAFDGVKLGDASLLEVSGMRLDRNYIRGAQFSPVVPRWRAFLLRVRGRKFTDSDPWSILRQLYSGPRSLFLFFFVIVFALPYVGRAAFYSTASAAEQKVIDSWTHQKDHWREPHRAVGGPAAEVIATPFDGAERFVRRNSQPRPLWQVLLKWDEGRILPSLLAVLLVLYNVGVY